MRIFKKILPPPKFSKFGIYKIGEGDWGRGWITIFPYAPPHQNFGVQLSREIKRFP